LPVASEEIETNKGITKPAEPVKETRKMQRMMRKRRIALHTPMRTRWRPKIDSLYIRDSSA